MRKPHSAIIAACAALVLLAGAWLEPRLRPVNMEISAQGAPWQAFFDTGQGFSENSSASFSAGPAARIPLPRGTRAIRLDPGAGELYYIRLSGARTISWDAQAIVRDFKPVHMLAPLSVDGDHVAIDPTGDDPQMAPAFDLARAIREAQGPVNPMLAIAALALGGVIYMIARSGAIKRIGGAFTLSRTIAALKILAVNMALFAALLAALELCWSFMMARPQMAGLLPSRALGLVKKVYMEHERNIIQFSTECARFDDELSYTLKPGGCVFENPEFSTRVDVNSLGIRADEAALDAPEVIVTGDSFAMGWGVRQLESFAEIIAARTGRRVLNAGVSSYGTVREMALVRRADLSAMNTLIIQYCSNDARENALGPEAREINSEEDFRRIADDQARKTRYYFGAHLRALWSAAASRTQEPPPRDARAEARAFIAALAKSGVSLEGVRIIVLDLEGGNANSPDFGNALRAEIAAPDAPAFARAIRIIDTHRILGREDYYLLDDHIRPQGHARLADAIISEMD